MSKKTIFINILESIAVLPLALIGAILLTPFVILYMLIHLPIIATESVWEKDEL